jgi:hypothetical protein
MVGATSAVPANALQRRATSASRGRRVSQEAREGRGGARDAARPRASDRAFDVAFGDRSGAPGASDSGGERMTSNLANVILVGAAALAIAGLTACSSSEAVADDGGAVDATTDVPDVKADVKSEVPSGGSLGAKCVADGDCAAGLQCARKGATALTTNPSDGEEYYPAGGYCTKACTVDADCNLLATGSLCWAGSNRTTAPHWCLAPCAIGGVGPLDPLDPAKCHGRADVACGSASGSYVCSPNCTRDDQCEAGDACNRMKGYCVKGLAHQDVAIGGTSGACGSHLVLSLAAGDGGTAYYCTATCTLGVADDCGAGAGCVISGYATTPGAGDRGSCARLCTCDDDCAAPTYCLQFASEAAGFFGRYGYCFVASGHPGKACPADAGVDAVGDVAEGG